MADEVTKVCGVCVADKPLHAFNKDKKGRYGVSGRCRSCNSLRCKEWRLANLEKTKEISREYYKNNKEKIIERSAKWHKDNPEKSDKIKQRYCINNPDRVKSSKLRYQETNAEAIREGYKDNYIENKEKIKARAKLWKRVNPEKVNATNAKRRAFKKNACPKWLTKIHLQEIENFYLVARDAQLITGEGYHVDHIIPLMGPNVSGLHVPWNLQVLPSDINMIKNTHYDEADVLCPSMDRHSHQGDPTESKHNGR